MKVSDSSHGFIIEKMRKWDALEFDPNKVYVNGNKSDGDEEEQYDKSDDGSN